MIIITFVIPLRIHVPLWILVFRPTPPRSRSAVIIITVEHILYMAFIRICFGGDFQIKLIPFRIEFNGVFPVVTICI